MEEDDEEDDLETVANAQGSATKTGRVTAQSRRGS